MVCILMMGLLPDLKRPQTQQVEQPTVMQSIIGPSYPVWLAIKVW